ILVAVLVVCTGQKGPIDKDGVQPAITVSVQNATSGSVTLSVFPDENASTPTDSVTLDVSSAGELTTTDLTVAEGNNLLRAALLDTSGVELTKDEVRVSLRTGSAAMVAITAPADGATLTDSDDSSAQLIGFQTDVRVTLTDVPDSQTIALSVNGSEVATGSTAAISSSFTFQEVTLPEGAVNIEVSVSGPDLVETLSDQVTVTVTLEEPQCEIVSISPAPGGGACDFDASSTDAEPETVGYQNEFTITLENCDSAAVELLINGQATGAVMATDGTAVAVVTLNEGENRVQATAIEGNRSGMSDEFVYLVDTQEPTVGFTNLIDGQVLNFLDDRDSDLSNGLDIVVELATEGADGASPSVGLSIGDTDLTADPDGDGNVRFDDVVLDMQGEIDLTATAVDACGNETSTTITVNVSLLALALSIDAPETGALLGPMEDNDLMAEGLQTEFTVTADGFVEGTEVAINCRRAGSQAFFRRGVAMVGAENTLNIPVTLPEGDYTCRAEVEGPPQVFSTGIDVSVVLAVAGVDITFPDDGVVVRETSVDVTALVVNAPAAQATLTVGDTSVTAQAVAGGLSFADVPLDEGANTLTVTLDAFPTATDTIDVILDTEAPTIIFNSPSTDASSVTEADDVTGSLDDGIQIDVAVTVSDTNPGSEVCISTGLSQAQCAVVQDDGTATVPGVQLIPGAVTLTATAEDQAGNTATTTLDVTVDIDRPVVTVTSP
ncbi:MAG: hypothetical protein AAFX99_30985, partial [Myxococcota bacterium]